MGQRPPPPSTRRSRRSRSCLATRRGCRRQPPWRRSRRSMGSRRREARDPTRGRFEFSAGAPPPSPRCWWSCRRPALLGCRASGAAPDPLAALLVDPPRNPSSENASEHAARKGAAAQARTARQRGAQAPRSASLEGAGVGRMALPIEPIRTRAAEKGATSSHHGLRVPPGVGQSARRLPIGRASRRPRSWT